MSRSWGYMLNMELVGNSQGTWSSFSSARFFHTLVNGGFFLRNQKLTCSLPGLRQLEAAWGSLVSILQRLTSFDFITTLDKIGAVNLPVCREGRKDKWFDHSHISGKSRTQAEAPESGFRTAVRWKIFASLSVIYLWVDKQKLYLGKQISSWTIPLSVVCCRRREMQPRWGTSHLRDFQGSLPPTSLEFLCADVNKLWRDGA